jgi:hypothetical protein
MKNTSTRLKIDNKKSEHTYTHTHTHTHKLKNRIIITTGWRY